jgi:hypothetical protein
MLRSVDWQLTTDMGQYIRPIVEGQAVQGDGTDSLSGKSVSNYQSNLRNIPEERRSHLHRGMSLNHAYLNAC